MVPEERDAAQVASLALLLDEREIANVLHRYCRGIDRCDTKVLRSVYHPGAIDEHGTFNGGADEFILWVVPVLKERYTATTHMLMNISIRVASDRALAESYVLASHVLQPRYGGGLVSFAGRYIDLFERRDSEWRIAHRKLVRDWDRVEPLNRSVDSFELVPVENYSSGQRSEDDLSYFNWAM
jgi:hypothetical protein